MVPAMTPATMPTSSRPDTCFAAMAARMTGKMPISVLNTSSSPASPGSLLSARHSAMAMKPGMEAIMMPRKLMRFSTEPCTAPAPAAEEPITGMYFSFHSFERAEMNATARVRFVVPVVPEAKRIAIE